jgi:hypothetical protein
MSEDELLSRRHPVQEDMPMQQRVWRFERVGWYVLVAIVLLALAGLFGNGPLSDAEVVSQDGRVRVEYQRSAEAARQTAFSSPFRVSLVSRWRCNSRDHCSVTPVSRRYSRSRNVVDVAWPGHAVPIGY